jgi:hypothetical protein
MTSGIQKTRPTGTLSDQRLTLICLVGRQHPVQVLCNRIPLRNRASVEVFAFSEVPCLRSNLNILRFLFCAFKFRKYVSQSLCKAC